MIDFGHHESDMDAIFGAAFKAGAAQGALEAAKLLRLIGDDAGADALLRHHELVVARASALERAHSVIHKARKVA